jgi:hypothetical protein
MDMLEASRAQKLDAFMTRFVSRERLQGAA